MSYIPNIPSAAYVIPCIRGARSIYGIKKNFRAEKIKSSVCKYYGVSEKEIISRSRVRHVVSARHMICYFARLYTNLTLKETSKLIGKRDHTTVIHAVGKINDQISLPFDNQVKEDIQNISMLIFKGRADEVRP